MIQDHPHVLDTHPFQYVSVCTSGIFSTNLFHILSIKVKEINFSYHVEKVFNVDIPALQHGNDGLIYTCVNAPYTAGTDKNMYVCNMFRSQYDHSFAYRQIEVEAAVGKFNRL